MTDDYVQTSQNVTTCIYSIIYDELGVEVTLGTIGIFNYELNLYVDHLFVKLKRALISFQPIHYSIIY